MHSYPIRLVLPHPPCCDCNETPQSTDERDCTSPNFHVLSNFLYVHCHCRCAPREVECENLRDGGHFWSIKIAVLLGICGENLLA